MFAVFRMVVSSTVSEGDVVKVELVDCEPGAEVVSTGYCRRW